MSGFNKDENMRGEHLLDTETGRLWPWTKILASNKRFQLVDRELYIKTHKKQESTFMEPDKENVPDEVVYTFGKDIKAKVTVDDTKGADKRSKK